MFAVAFVSALVLQQASPAAGQAVWSTPAEPVAAAPAAPIPTIPDWARADPYGYERSECSPILRRAEETMEACQARVRTALAANLGSALPSGLGGGDPARNCRQEAAGDRYAMQCGAPQRAGAAPSALQERTCETRPRAQAQGGVRWSEECRPANGVREQEGLRIRLGGKD